MLAFSCPSPRGRAGWDGVGAPQVKKCSRPSSSPGERQAHAPQAMRDTGAGDRELCGDSVTFWGSSALAVPGWHQLMPSGPICPRWFSPEPRAVRWEQMPSRPVTFRGLASDELHRTRCQQLCLSCRLSLLHHSWLFLFFPLSVSFFKSALTSEPGSVAHLGCWRVTPPLLLLTAVVRLWTGNRAFSVSHGTATQNFIT